MTYREPVPEDCPPDDAEEVIEPLIVFRLVRNNPPTYDDFRSQRAEKPNQKFNVSECQARGLSVFLNPNEAAKCSKYRNLRDTLVCRVILNDGAGRIQQTGRRYHCTWWPLADFDILANCQVM